MSEELKDSRPYTPISCDYVDYIEHLATLRRAVDIEYRLDGQPQIQKDDRIKTWENESGVEYLISRSGLKIRMDDIIAINGKAPGGDNCSI